MQEQKTQNLLKVVRVILFFKLYLWQWIIRALRRIGRFVLFSRINNQKGWMKSEGYFRTQSNIYDEALLQKQLTAKRRSTNFLNFARIPACCCLRKSCLLKRWRKIQKVAFHSALASLHNFFSSCTVYGAIMSVFLPLQYFYFRNSYYK